MRAIYLSRFSLPFSRLMVVSRVSLSLILSPSSLSASSKIHLFTSDKREPFLLSLSLSLLVLFRFGERKRASRHRFFEGDDDDDGFAGLSLQLRGAAKHR